MIRETTKFPLDTISARDTKHSGMIKINSARARDPLVTRLA